MNSLISNTILGRVPNLKWKLYGLKKWLTPRIAEVTLQILWVSDLASGYRIVPTSIVPQLATVYRVEWQADRGLSSDRLGIAETLQDWGSFYSIQIHVLVRSLTSCVVFNIRARVELEISYETTSYSGPVRSIICLPLYRAIWSLLPIFTSPLNLLNLRTPYLLSETRAFVAFKGPHFRASEYHWRSYN